MAYNERIVSLIQQLTGKNYVLLTTRCNAAIMLALKLGKQRGYTSVTIPDIGGWMTYEQFAIKLKLPVYKIPTIDGKIDVSSLKLQAKTILLVHSLAGYHWRLETKAISEVAKHDDALFVEDICGTIGEPAFGDIVVCSFGSAKPVNFGTGGFFATNDVSFFDYAVQNSEPIEFEAQALLDKLTLVNLNKRKQKLYDKREDLRRIFVKEGFNPEGDYKALILIVTYKSEEDKKKLEALCVANGVEFTQCPRYIRSGKQALSIEIKRL